MGSVVQEFLARSKRKGYKKLLTEEDTVLTAKEYEKSVTKGMSGDAIVKFNGVNEETFEDIILSIDHTTKQRKLHLVWLKTAKRPNIWKGIAS